MSETKVGIRLPLAPLAPLAMLISLSVCAGFGLTSCQSTAEHGDAQSSASLAPQPASFARQPASFDSRLVRERAFLEAMAEDSNPDTFRVSYLDRVLEIYFRSELYIEEFEERLNVAVKKQKQNPKYRENLLESEGYVRELKMRALAEQAVDDIEYMYRRLLETANSPTATAVEKAHAKRLINSIYTWLSVRPAEDKVLLATLYDRLYAVKRDFDASKTRSESQADMPRREVASESYDFDRSFFKVGDLTPIYKKHFKKIHAKAVASLKWHDAAADSPVGFIADRPRQPSSITPLHPDPGGDGTVTGLTFPEAMLSFTFDDGPDYTNDLRLIGYLREHRDVINTNGLPTNFFWQVKNIKDSMASIPLAKSSAITMNNHTWDHPDLMTQTPDQLNHEINDANATLTAAFGKQPTLGNNPFRFFRCPYGSCLVGHSATPDMQARSQHIRKMIADLHLINAYWTIDSRDWALPHQQQRIFDLTTKQIVLTGHGIILMHDIHDWTIDSAKMIFDWIKDQNDNHGAKWRVVNLETAVDENNRMAAEPHPQAQPAVHPPAQLLEQTPVQTNEQAPTRLQEQAPGPTENQ